MCGFGRCVEPGTIKQGLQSCGELLAMPTSLMVRVSSAPLDSQLNTLASLLGRKVLGPPTCCFESLHVCTLRTPTSWKCGCCDQLLAALCGITIVHGLFYYMRITLQTQRLLLSVAFPVALVCSDATLRDLESGMARLRLAEEQAGQLAEHTREEVRANQIHTGSIQGSASSAFYGSANCDMQSVERRHVLGACNHACG
jgi:hypothetical protein